MRGAVVDGGKGLLHPNSMIKWIIGFDEGDGMSTRHKYCNAMVVALIAFFATQAVSAKLQYGFDPDSVKKNIAGRTLVVPRSCSERVFIAEILKPNYAKSFPGKSDSDGQFRMDRSADFWKGFQSRGVDTRVVLDSSSCSPLVVEAAMNDPISGFVVYLDTTKLDTTKLYLARSQIIFGKGSESVVRPRGILGTTSLSNLSAMMIYGVYDPRRRVLIYTTIQKGVSSSPGLLDRRITGDDWSLATNDLGSSVAQSLRDIFK